MRRHTFDPECPHCRPVLINPVTMRVLPDTHPNMVTLLEVWRAAPQAEQEAFHRVTVHGSQDPSDLQIVGSLYERLQKLWIEKGSADVKRH